jgi:hypothetical protein
MEYIVLDENQLNSISDACINNIRKYYTHCGDEFGFYNAFNITEEVFLKTIKWMAQNIFLNEDLENLRKLVKRIQASCIKMEATLKNEPVENLSIQWSIK